MLLVFGPKKQKDMGNWGTNVGLCLQGAISVPNRVGKAERVPICEQPLSLSNSNSICVDYADRVFLAFYTQNRINILFLLICAFWIVEKKKGKAISPPSPLVLTPPDVCAPCGLVG